MAVKRRHARSRSRKRRTHWKVAAPNLARCDECGAPVEAHRACPECGAYGGRRGAVRVAVAEPKKEKKA